MVKYYNYINLNYNDLLKKKACRSLCVIFNSVQENVNEYLSQERNGVDN